LCSITTTGPEINATTIGTSGSTTSHPVRHRFGVIAINLCLLNRLPLTLTNSRPMKILLAVRETQTNGLYMAFKADFTPTGQFLVKKVATTMNASKFSHQYTPFSLLNTVI
jgi:hypothetical protein